MESLILVGGAVFIVVVSGVAVSSAIKVMPFAYSSARVKAARGHMLSDEELVSLTHQGYKDVLYQLEKKGYSEILDLIDVDFREEQVQKELGKKQFKDLKKLADHVPNNYKKFFKILSSRKDFELILTVLRSKTNPHFKRHALHTFILETPYFPDIKSIESASIEEFTNMLKRTPYSQLVSPYIEQVKKGELAHLEQAIYDNYYTALRRESRKDSVLRAYVNLMIDTHNVKKSLSSKETFIQGGTLTKNQISKLKSARTVEEVIIACEKSHFIKFIRDAKTTTQIIKGMEKSQKAFANKLLMQEPLSIKPILAYYIQKTIELKNVRILLKLIHAHFDQSDIERALI